MNVVESKFDKTCDIFGYVKNTDSSSHITSTTRTKLYESQKCRICIKSYPNTTNNANFSSTTQGVTMYISPLLDIPSGSEVEVSDGRRYVSSGIPKVLPTHQEIQLVSAERYA